MMYGYFVSIGPLIGPLFGRLQVVARLCYFGVLLY
jgi:hypothetical protein